ncbi:MAG: molecular chaperone TorD family protein, partial [Geobacteraceae bacterium]|nr:molecular chaperone TorD family protein [Geobacteraceae bacterium]
MSPFPSSSSAVPESISSVARLPIIESRFQLLASLFRYPVEPLWQALSQALPAADPFSSGLLGHPLSLPLHHSLEQTYTALFCSTQSGSPVSLCLGGYLNQTEHGGSGTAMISQLLTEEGLVIDPHLNAPEDHLAVLLELAGLLCCKVHGDDPARAADGRIRLLKLTDSMLVMLPPFQSA